MTGDLVRWIDEQLEASTLEDEAGLLVLAALEGDQAFADYVGGGAAPSRPSADETSGDVEPGGTFLSSLTVEGFRGIGPATTVSLTPRPGLTVIAGRNGSGKSSLSEALEFVLTGDTYRWNSKSSVAWRKSWRNLHHDRAQITVGVVEEDSGPVTISATWAADDIDVESASVKTQRAGKQQTDGLAELGWAKALEQFRPILSYDELGGLLEGSRAQLYDALASILGVEQLADALKRIQAELKTRKIPGTELGSRRRELATAARIIDDERAAEAAKLLGKTSPDTDALRGLATGGTTPDTGPVGRLRALIQTTAPYSADKVTEAITSIRDAVAAVADAKADVSERSMARLEVLESALRLHSQHGDMSCPVCQVGSLDATWHEASTGLVDQQRKDYAVVRRTRQDLAVALGRARQLVSHPPASLSAAPPVPEVASAMAEARTAWERWSTAPAGDDATAAQALADHLSSHEVLTTALEKLREAAEEQLTALDDTWQPLATRIGTWCDEWEDWLEAKPLVDRLAAADKWLKENDTRLKNERLTPIADGARAAWAKLRQESNVDIAKLELTGSNTSRRVVIDASVDGTEGEGFTVLSQGELQALALSLFIPRATMAASPFRFLVLDDPVQAMDPAKVDGLVDLLSELAATRQVIVLSHDDRLPAAVRRADVDATILEVSRGAQSRVSVDVATDPATRYLSDAFALIKEWEEERLPEDVMRRTLPGLLRFAAEAAARDAFFGNRLKQGDELVDVEAAWTSASTTRQRVNLAVFGEDKANHMLDEWAKAPYQTHALRNIGSAMHTGLKADLDPKDAARDVERLVDDLRSGS